MLRLTDNELRHITALADALITARAHIGIFEIKWVSEDNEGADREDIGCFAEEVGFLAYGIEETWRRLVEIQRKFL